MAYEYLGWGLGFVENRGLELFRVYLLAYRACSELNQGRWAESLDCASLVLREPFPSTLPPALAFTAIGLVRARRGDPDQSAPLDEALALVEPSRELQRLAPVAAARAEAAWLEGMPEGSLAPRGPRSSLRCGAVPIGRSASSPAGAGVPGCWMSPRPPPRSPTPCRSRVTGGEPPSCGARSDAPTRPPWHLPTPTTRTRCAGR